MLKLENVQSVTSNLKNTIPVDKDAAAIKDKILETKPDMVDFSHITKGGNKTKAGLIALGGVAFSALLKLGIDLIKKSKTNALNKKADEIYKEAGKEYLSAMDDIKTSMLVSTNTFHDKSGSRKRVSQKDPSHYVIEEIKDGKVEKIIEYTKYNEIYRIAYVDNRFNGPKSLQSDGENQNQSYLKIYEYKDRRLVEYSENVQNAENNVVFLKNCYEYENGEFSDYYERVSITPDGNAVTRGHKKGK